MSLFGKRGEPPPAADYGGKGAVRIGEVVLPVTAVALAHGEVVITCGRYGPLPQDSGPVRVFGADGSPVTETENSGWISTKAIRSGEYLTMVFSMRVNNVDGPSSVDWT